MLWMHGSVHASRARDTMVTTGFASSVANLEFFRKTPRFWIGLVWDGLLLGLSSAIDGHNDAAGKQSVGARLPETNHGTDLHSWLLRFKAAAGHSIGRQDDRGRPASIHVLRSLPIFCASASLTTIELAQVPEGSRASEMCEHAASKRRSTPLSRERRRAFKAMPSESRHRQDM